VAGQGTLQGELQAAAQRFGIQVVFSGWLDSIALAHLYKRSAVVIASGRAALEALARGRPTLALASVGAAEVFDPSQLPKAAYSNFGGYGAKPVQSLDALFDRLYAAAMHLEAKYANEFSMFVQTQHENTVVNQRLLNLYGRVS
jgi:glycosyltransferase involved in cell wall biosynthesis